jgi:hypothetical protein
MESITRQATERGITDAAIVALIGAIDNFTVSTDPAGPTAHTHAALVNGSSCQVCPVKASVLAMPASPWESGRLRLGFRGGGVLVDRRARSYGPRGSRAGVG